MRLLLAKETNAPQFIKDFYLIVFIKSVVFPKNVSLSGCFKANKKYGDERNTASALDAGVRVRSYVVGHRGPERRAAGNQPAARRVGAREFKPKLAVLAAGRAPAKSCRAHGRHRAVAALARPDTHGGRRLPALDGTPGHSITRGVPVHSAVQT